MNGKKRTAFMITLLLMSLLVFSTTSSAASKKPQFAKRLDLTLDRDKIVGVGPVQASMNYKITKVSSSNTGVVEVFVAVREASSGFAANLHKAGKSVITITTKVGSKQYTHKMTIYVWKKRINPLKTFTIGSTNYAKKFKKNNTFYWPDGKNVNQNDPFKMKLMKGWKLTKMKVEEFTDDDAKKPYKKTFKKAPSKIPMTDGTYNIELEFKCKTGQAAKFFINDLRVGKKPETEDEEEREDEE